MEEHHQDRVLKNTQSREEDEEETVNKHRVLSCYYSLRENPKKKTHKYFGLDSPESMKKILFRCQECGKGFRYEKCLRNHQTGVHLSTNQRVYEESMKSLCSSFSLVKKKKRSRVIRYKKTSLSCSFTTFPDQSHSVFAAIDEELEVAECLILLSMSSPKFVDGLKLVSEAIVANPETLRDSYDSSCFSNKKPRKAGEFESEFLSDEQNLMNEETRTDDTFQGPARFLGHKYESDQQKLKGCDFDNGYLSNEQKLMEEQVNDFESMFLSNELGVGAMECSDSDTEMGTESNKKNDEQHQCRLCNKIFSSYQALGGHQTFHRMSKSKNKKNCREESVQELEDDFVTVTREKKKSHECSICSKVFRSVHALGGHMKSHGNKRQHLKTEDHEDLELLGVVPVGIELY